MIWKKVNYIIVEEDDDLIWYWVKPKSLIVRGITIIMVYFCNIDTDYSPYMCYLDMDRAKAHKERLINEGIKFKSYKQKVVG